MELLPAYQEIAQLRWTPERAWKWRNARPWSVGCNFLPSSAINQLEMWQADTFDPKILDRELGWLAAIGMNSMRVFLHDLLWQENPAAFLERMEQYLAIAGRHGISSLFVFFDSCWFPFPRAGKQPEPEPGVHNSGWLQSPGVAVLRDPNAFARLEPYVTGVVEHFRDDARIEGWDVWNEPDNSNGGSYGSRDIGEEKKGDIVLPLMAKAFGWIRAARPSQPLTSGVWRWTADYSEEVFPLQQFQVEASDVISFHDYMPLEASKRAVENLKRYGRPLLCTEYMARPAGSTFEAILPYFKAEGIAAYNWGAVAGKSQTYYPWDSWQSPYPPEPPIWHHDILRPDGSAYRPEETETIRKVTAR
jgi:hypothetical protein